MSEKTLETRMSGSRIDMLQRQMTLVERVLDLDEGVAFRCKGAPSECAGLCTEQTCPLQNNRLFTIGSMVATLLEEIRWVRAWAHELESSGSVPAGAVERTNMRVRLGQLREQLEQFTEHEEAVRGVLVLEETVGQRVTAIRGEIHTLEAQLGDTL